MGRVRLRTSTKQRSITLVVRSLRQKVPGKSRRTTTSPGKILPAAARPSRDKLGQPARTRNAPKGGY